MTTSTVEMEMIFYLVKKRLPKMRKVLLILLFVVSVFASDKRVGIPFIPQGEGKVDSMVISKDGEYIYTLKDNLVTQYSLSPFTKSDSFQVTLHHPKKTYSNYKGYQIAISNDSQRIILYSQYEIELWDIKTKKRLKNIKNSLTLGAISKYGFLTLSQEGGKNILKIYDDKDLSLVKTVDIPYRYPFENDTGIEGYGEMPLAMYPDKNLLFVRYMINGVVFNLNTFEIEEIIELNEESIKKLKVKYPEYFKSKIWQMVMNNSGYDYFTISSCDCKMNRMAEKIFVFKLVSRKDMPYYIIVKTNKKLKGYILYQFENSWVLLGKRRAGSCFSYSGDIEKYLQMKIDDKVIPINNTTFQKYNTKIYLKD